MNLPTQKEMLWFVSELVDIRNDLKRTPNHIADIEFDCKKILKKKSIQRSIFGLTTKEEARTKVQEMLVLIKSDGEFLDSLNNFNGNRLQWEFTQTNDALLKIKGYQTKLLIAYRKERILKGEKVFGLTTNAKGQQVLLVCGVNTGKRIESQEQFRAFCYFLNNPGRIIPYLEIFEEFKRGALHDSNFWNTKYPTVDKKELFVQSTVYNLKRKLIEIGIKYDIDIDKVLETYSKKGFQYNV